MNIWILNHYAGGPYGQATRDYDRGRELVARGHRVTIFSAAFSHYKLRDDILGPKDSHKEDIADGVRFIWIKTTPYQRNNWRRAVNMVSFAWRAYLIGRRMSEHPDAIIGTSVHPIAPLAAYLLTKKKKSRFFFTVTDLWPQTLIEMGLISKHNPIVWALRRLEVFLYRRAIRIFSILPYAYEYIERLGIPKEKIVWIPNGVDLRYFANIRPYEGGNSHKFTFMYLGGHAPHLGLDVILDSAKILQDAGEHRIHFVFVGDGMEKTRLVQRSIDLGLRKVEFRDAVPKGELYKSMEQADGLICHFRDLPLLRYGSSMFKIFDYLASSRPIIYAVSGRNNPVKEANAGITIPPEDSASMAKALKDMVDMSPEDRIQLGKNGYNHVKAHYNISTLAGLMERML